MNIEKIKPVVYVSGPATSCGEFQENIKIAHKHAMKLRAKGFSVICPHTNGGDKPEELTWDLWMQEDYSLLLRSDAIYMLPNWEKSKGAKIEKEWADELGIPVFYSTQAIDIIYNFFFWPDTVWERCPKQVHGFLKIIHEMFRLHLKKNSDYSPWNIKGTGEIGLMTRFWDKTSRLMNLMGFDLGTGRYSTPKLAKNESVEDTIIDSGVYAIIWRLYRMGCWGE